MINLIRRDFTVELPLEAAWRHLARVEQWPSWARHIRRIELRPPGELGPQSTGVIHLRNGLKCTFRMTEFNPPHNWKWDGRFLWLTVHYDHQFEKSAGQTRLIWVVQASGLGAGVLGRLFARLYRASLDKAIPRLIAEMNATGSGAGRVPT